MMTMMMTMMMIILIIMLLTMTFAPRTSVRQKRSSGIMSRQGTSPETAASKDGVRQSNVSGCGTEQEMQNIKVLKAS